MSVLSTQKPLHSFYLQKCSWTAAFIIILQPKVCEKKTLFFCMNSPAMLQYSTVRLKVSLAVLCKHTHYLLYFSYSLVNRSSCCSLLACCEYVCVISICFPQKILKSVKAIHRAALDSFSAVWTRLRLFCCLLKQSRGCNDRRKMDDRLRVSSKLKYTPTFTSHLHSC